MQWVYLILFVFTVLVPQAIHPMDFPTFGHENVESAIIFLLGVIGFSIFHFRERTIRRHIDEKKKYRLEAANASRDLVHSYTYIGEVNRQLEVLKTIALGLPKKGKMSDKQREHSFDALLEAVAIFSRADGAAFRFVKKDSSKDEGTISFGNSNTPSFSAEELSLQREAWVEYPKGVVIRGRREEDGYRAYLCLNKKGNTEENLAFLRAILMRALELFVQTK